MSGPTIGVLSEDLKDLRAEVHRIEISLAETRTEIRVAVGLVKWVTVVLGGGMFLVVISTAGWGVSITTQVQGLRVEVDATRADVDKLRLDSEKNRLDLERLRIDVEQIRVAVAPGEVRKAVHETGPAPKP